MMRKAIMDVRFCVFCLIALCKISGFMIYSRKILVLYDSVGIYGPVMQFHDTYFFIFVSFISFISMCYAYLTYSYFHVLVYFIFGINGIFSIVLAAPYLGKKWLVFIFLGPQVLELIYVLYNFRLFCGRALYIYNKRAGNDFKIKFALKVSNF